MHKNKIFKPFCEASIKIETGLKKITKTISVKEQKEFEAKKLKKLFSK